MGKLELILNIIHYQLYRWECFTQRVLGYPINLLLRIEIIKRFYKKRGVDNIEKLVNDTVNDYSVGMSSILAGNMMLIIVGFLFFSPFVILAKSIWCENGILIGALSSIPLSYYILNKFIFKKNKYLNYFKQFDKNSKKWKSEWAWITFLISIFVILYNIFWILIFGNIFLN